MRAVSLARRHLPCARSVRRLFSSELDLGASALPESELGGSQTAVSRPHPTRFFSFRPHCGPHGSSHVNLLPVASLWYRANPTFSIRGTTCFSTESSAESSSPEESVAELYEKMRKSVEEVQSMPPNAWLWSMISKCSKPEDIKLLFKILDKLRIFRLSNLRIYANFNCHLCMRVAEACTKAGALDFGMMTLMKHNAYGLTPLIGSAHYLLRYAEKHNRVEFMKEVMKVLQRNDLPLQAGTADIVFSICYKADNWDLLSSYARKFVKAGVQLHHRAFNIWMEFAAKNGDAKSIWMIDSERAKYMKQHTLYTGFACAKGFILARKTKSAAAAIKLLYESLSENRKPQVKDHLEKMFKEWPCEVSKRREKPELEEQLRADIMKMVAFMSKSGLDLEMKLEGGTELQSA